MSDREPQPRQTRRRTVTGGAGNVSRRIGLPMGRGRKRSPRAGIGGRTDLLYDPVTGQKRPRPPA